MDTGSLITIIVLILFAPALLFILWAIAAIDPTSPTSSGPMGVIYKLFNSGTIATNPLNGLAQSIGRIFATLPDSLTIGSLLLAVIFQSLPLLMIFTTIIELSIGRIAIGTLASYLSPSFSLVTSAGKGKCAPGVSYGTMESIAAAASAKFNIAFPSESMFIMGGLASYVMSSIIQFRQELTALGPEWEARIYIVAALIGVGMFAYIIYQVGNGCATIGSLLVSTFMAVLAGLLISFQNKAFLGKESINVLGLPFLDERVQTGAPLYVCSKKEESTNKNTCS
jgi:hypothetical protein